MVTVRTVSTPQTREAATPNVDIRTRVSPDDFGAGLGRGIVSASKSVGVIAAQKKEERSRQSFANANARLLELDEHAAETLQNPETGYRVSQGEDTLSRYGETLDSYDKKSQELAGTITDPEARSQFELKSRRRRVTYTGSVNTKASTEREKLFNNNHAAIQRNELLRQADNYASPVAVDVGLHNRIQNELEYMDHAGINPEGEDGKGRIKAIMAESYGVVIETALNNGDPVLAGDYLKRDMVTDALGVNQTRDFMDRLTTGNHLLQAQEISTRGLADERASDLGTINDLQIEGDNQIRANLSGEAQKLALQQWHAGIETRKRLLNGQKNAYEDNTIGDAMSKVKAAEAMSVATIASERDPVFGAKLQKAIRQKHFGDHPNDALSRSAFISVKAKAENGDYDEMSENRLTVEMSAAGLTFAMQDKIKKFLAAPEKEPITQAELLRTYRQMQKDPTIKQVPFELENVIMSELFAITNGDRPATRSEKNAVIGEFALDGYGAGINLLGTDRDDLTRFELGQIGEADSFTAYLTPEDEVRLTRELERAYRNNPEEMGEITPERLQRILTTEQITGNTAAEQFEIATAMIDIETGVDNQELRAQDKAVQTAIIQRGADGDGKVTVDLTWQQSVDLIVYDANNEPNDWRTERISKYPSDLPTSLVKKLSAGNVWWNQIVGEMGLMNMKINDIGGYQQQLERLRAQKPSFAKGVEAGIKFIEGGGGKTLPTGIVPQSTNTGIQQASPSLFPQGGSQSSSSIFQPFNRR